MSSAFSSYSLFGGTVRSLNTTLGINQSPTVVTATVVRDSQPIDISNRQLIDISIGAFDFRGVVQSWNEAKQDIAGTGVYQVRITDTKPVLNATQVIIGSSFDDTKTQAYDYGDNVIAIIPENASQISNGIPFDTIKTVVEATTIRYGNQNYTVDFNFTLPTRGSSVQYTLKGRALSLSELISQIANDHGLDWYVTTSTSNVISINMFGRTNITNMTVNQLAALHPNAIIRRHEGEENRDAIQKAVLLGGYRAYLHQADGSLWEQFWGFDENDNKRLNPVYSETVMEAIINNNFTSDDYTEEDVQKILSYANEFWGRKFIGLITPPTAISSDGRSWVTPTSAGWNESDSIPMEFNRDGQLKFQTDDGRWVTFATLPLPGTRSSEDGTLTYQWDDELFSNPNSHIDKDGNIAVKASLEIIDGFTEMEFLLEQFIIYILNLSELPNMSSAVLSFFLLYPDTALIVRFDFIRFLNTIWTDIVAIFDRTLIYTDAVKNRFRQDFRDQYFVLTLATPLRVKSVRPTTVINSETGLPETSNVIVKTRLETLDDAYLALLDQRETYGPWSNREQSVGRTEVIIDPSLTPWLFGYRGIINSTGLDLLNQVALAKIKTVADITMDAKTAELEVAGVPAINLGDQLQTTGVITSMQIIFAINGVRTIYKASQYTTELSRYVRQQQDLLDKLRRQAAEFNNTMNPTKDDWELDRTIRTLKKELPEPSVDVSTEGRRQPKTLLGRVSARSSTIQPKYTILPMAWSSDAFGELTLVRDPQVLGQYYNVVNMGEKQTAPGRLPVGTDVQVNEFSITDGGVVSYYIDVAVAKTPSFAAIIQGSISNSQPIYKVTPVINAVQQINLTSSELLNLSNVLNIGEPVNHRGYLPVGTEVMIYWNENNDGSFTPFMEQQLNMFKPV